MECIYTCDSCGFKCQTIKSFDFHIVTEHIPYQNVKDKVTKDKSDEFT